MNKTYINTDDKFDQDIKNLQIDNPGFSKTVLIKMAVRYAAENRLVISAKLN
jgi:hypothetical protein